MTTPSTAKPERPWPQALAWGAFLGVLFFGSYSAANHFTAQRSDVGVYVFGWELHIPFLAWTILPYWSIDFLYGIALFAARSRDELFRLAKRLLAAQVICITGFLLWPLHFSFSRPETHGWAGALFDALTGFDLPYNQAPSLHICLLIVLWRFYAGFLRPPLSESVRPERSKAKSKGGTAGAQCFDFTRFAPYAQHERFVGGLAQRWPTLGMLGLLHLWFAMIAVSVLTTYQHHFIDLLTGFWAGALCLLLVPDADATWRWRGHEPGRLRLALYYFAGALLCAGFGALLFPSAFAWLLYWTAAALAGVAGIYLFGEGAHFGKRDGGMPWRSWMFFGPYLLGARLNVWLWTRKLPVGAEVLDGVFLGRQPDAATLTRHEIDHVIDLAAELPLAACPKSASGLPLQDLIPPSLAQLASAADAIEDAHQKRLRVWVCCALGFSRSAACVAAWLVRHRGHTPEQALATIRQARPQIVLNPVTINTLPIPKEAPWTPCLRR
ncbi:dual specificity protein phosphatase family protein [Uliginosibacterium sp. 31-16]|uniref:dual specificity protein phosphatase family protein n=1 Tax=Uliginosibacterium sp. 31-16 TaxID=3068315 RepID=UPI00273D05B3|nr:dual specificity protein phosphatase family protein [Uliginosibacterium sp. 31-16]MDP5239953.1 dual specificity protein phosphatase family protein [Uliginosibacterium sp. 31-16]